MNDYLTTVCNMPAEQRAKVLSILLEIATSDTLSVALVRQQLCEQLPQTFTLAASGLGVTQKVLTDCIYDGDLPPAEFLRALVRGADTKNLGLDPKIVQGSVRIQGLTESVDYTIDYDLGIVTFVDIPLRRSVSVVDYPYQLTPSRKKRGKRKVKEWWNK